MRVICMSRVATAYYLPPAEGGNSVRHSFCVPRQTPSSVVWERLWSRSPLLVTTVERLQLGNVGFHFCLGRAGEGMTEHLIGAPCGLPPGPQRDEQTSDDRDIDLDGDPVGVMASQLPTVEDMLKKAEK
jgi:hypothetical protein